MSDISITLKEFFKMPTMVFCSFSKYFLAVLGVQDFQICFRNYQFLQKSSLDFDWSSIELINDLEKIAYS